MDSLLLMLIEKGEMRIAYEGQKYVAKKGDIVLMDGANPQYYDTTEYVEFYWLHVAGINCFELCAHLTRTADSIIHRNVNHEKAAIILRFLVLQFANHQPIVDSEHSRLLHSVFCYLMPDVLAAPAEESGPVQQAVQFIQLHLEENLNLDRLAKQVHLSPSHLIRLFRAELRHSPHEYIILMRMDRAKYLLKTTTMPIKVIAHEVGYQTESSFTSTFTEKIGISPRRFRDIPLG